MTPNKFWAIEKELNDGNLERQEVVRGLLVALLAKKHVLLLGPPGTGKNMLAEDICNRIDGGQFFEWLLSRTSTPEELFGPISLKALENDSYRRVTDGKLPEATIAFLDEIWKCNSAVLNATLGILNERKFQNDGQTMQVPLEMCVGASNELPEDREELGALWDRFIMRYVVDYLKDDRNFERLLKLDPIAVTKKMTITAGELSQAQADCCQVKVDKALPLIAQLRKKLQEMQIQISDRRWRAVIGIVQANAWLDGRDAASENDLAPLTAALWVEKDQIRQIRQAIIALANPLDMKAQDLLDEVTEVFQTAINAPDDQKTAAGMEANGKIKYVLGKLETLAGEARTAGKGDTRIVEVIARVADLNKEVLEKCLKLKV
jgi:MoxR-like ATPase